MLQRRRQPLRSVEESPKKGQLKLKRMPLRRKHHLKQSRRRGADVHLRVTRNKPRPKEKHTRRKHLRKRSVVVPLFNLRRILKKPQNPNQRKAAGANPSNRLRLRSSPQRSRLRSGVTSPPKKNLRSPRQTQHAVAEVARAPPTHQWTRKINLQNLANPRSAPQNPLKKPLSNQRNVAAAHPTSNKNSNSNNKNRKK